MELNAITQPTPADKYDADIAILKDASRLHLWRDTENQHRNFSTILEKLTRQWTGCGDVEQAPPSLDVDLTCPIPHFNRTEDGLGHIYMDKYSVVTLLHEFGHFIELDEAECVIYSEWVFANAFPVSFSRLERDARGYLCKPGTGVAAPVFYNTGEYGLANTDSPATINTETM